MAVANLKTSLKCKVCTATLTLYNKFCAACGAELDEETLALKYYFNEGYKSVRPFCAVCLITTEWNELANAQGESQVTRRRKLLDSNNQDVRAIIQEELDGPGC